IHLSSYGLDPESAGKETLIDLIEAVSKIPGIERIRLGSFEPMIIKEDFVKRLSAVEKICPHFHLSLQSGCDATLKRMNRQYTTEEYAHSVDLLRKYFDSPAITTDVITGFPGETEEEFAATVEFLKKIAFYEIHVFPYSKREGTKAATMKGQLPKAVKKERSNVLLSLTAEDSKKYRASFIDHEVSVLLEEPLTIDGEKYMTGYTPEYVKVAVKKEALSPNTVIKGTVKGFLLDDLMLLNDL
ncbi:MAG: radical SAM protein, partial [Lachnospiraceae bacterium]|nr:radical SAM protein [Lachnospiraceae bacterium]